MKAGPDLGDRTQKNAVELGSTAFFIGFRTNPVGLRRYPLLFRRFGQFAARLEIFFAGTPQESFSCAEQEVET